jgi:S-adenosylmethionine-dependent methyltransferase
MSKVEKFYDENVEQEWGRLDRHLLEYGHTIRLLERFVPPGARVLDVGGGPGRYSFHLAEEGRAVTLCDLSAGNVAFARAHAQSTGINLAGMFQANVLDLDAHTVGQFDVVLCMGPLYHLLEEEQRARAIENCLSVLRPNGVLFVAFISAWAPLIETMRNRPAEIIGIKDRLLGYLDDGRNREGADNPGFTDAYFIRPDAIEPFMARFPLQKLTLTGTEGLAHPTAAGIYEAGERAVAAAIDIAERTGEDPQTWASCDHFLYVGRKI